MQRLLLFWILLISMGFSQKPLRVGMELAYAPFEMKNKEGNPAGISVDMADDFGKFIGREVEVVDINWVGLVPAVRSGKVDIIISSMGITEKRKKAIDFSDPYINMSLYVLASKKSGIRSIADIKKEKYKIAVKSGTTSHIFAMKAYKDYDLTLMDQFGTVAMEVLKGAADFTMYDAISVYKFWSKNKDKLVFLNETVGGDSFNAAAFKKGNDALRKQFNQWIKKAQKDGFFEKISTKYLSDIQQEFKKRNISFLFDIN